MLIHEVGLKNPNGWGLYDMHGNGAEFCLDKYSKRGSDPVWDPKGPMQDEIDPVKPEANRFATIRGGGRWSSKYPTDATGANNCTYYYGACYAYSESIGIARFVLQLD